MSTMPRSVAFAGVALAALCGASSAQSVTLKFASMAPERNPINQCGPVAIMEAITKRTGGKVKFTRFFAGTALSHPLRQYQQLAKNVTDMSQGVLTYTPGRFPLTSLAALPFLMKDNVAGARAVTRVVQAHLQNEFKDIHLLAIVVPALYQIHLRKEIKTIDDMKGLRLRGAGRVHQMVLKALGSVPAQLPAPRIYESLSKGVIDGALFPWSGMLSWKIGEVTNYSLGVTLNGATMFLGMSKKAYDGLPADAKAVIDSDFTGPKLAAWSSNCWTPVDAKGLAIAKKQNKVVMADAGMQADFRKRLAGVSEAYIAGLEKKGLPARKILAAMKKAIAEEEAK